MKIPIPLALFIVCLMAGSKADSDWVKYKDETHIKVFDDKFVNFEEAKTFCSGLSDGPISASMVMVKDAEMQRILEDLTNTVLEPVWLGGRRDVASSGFKWEGDVSVPADDNAGWNNWEMGYPTGTTEACMVLETQALKKSAVQKGKWFHTSCARRNLVVCQKTLKWALSDAYDQIQIIANMVVPVGSIYVEYPSQSPPEELWPTLSWTDVTDQYAGLFFRAEGGDSADWGVKQDGCASRITQMQYEQKPSTDPAFRQVVSIPSSGWSESGRAGYMRDSGNVFREGLQFYSEACEVRPTNKAFRLWKRTAKSFK